jgi:hypothetical protein
LDKARAPSMRPIAIARKQCMDIGVPGLNKTPRVAPKSKCVRLRGFSRKRWSLTLFARLRWSFYRGTGMTYEIEQKLRPELTRDERLIWSGVPQPGLRWRSSDWFAVPFALFWCYMVFGIHGGGAYPPRTPFYLQPQAIPFALIGFYVLIGRFFVDWYQRSRTYYGLTDQRVIIVDGMFNRRVKSLTLATLTDISLSERSNGSGSISFGSGALSGSWFGRPSWRGMNNAQVPQFDLIDNVRRVYALVREAQQANRAR